MKTEDNTKKVTHLYLLSSKEQASGVRSKLKPTLD